MSVFCSVGGDQDYRSGVVTYASEYHLTFTNFKLYVCPVSQGKPFLSNNLYPDFCQQHESMPCRFFRKFNLED